MKPQKSSNVPVFWPTAVPRRPVRWYPGEARDIVRYLLDQPSAEECVRGFEEGLEQYLGTPHAIVTSSGRQALRFILEEMGIGAGDEVIVPAYTEEGVPRAIQATGAAVVFADVRREDHNISPDDVRRRITPRTRAILATHLFGSPSDLDAFENICAEHGLVLLEDGAHALGQRLNGQTLGTFGRAALFSFGGTKPFQTFGGGLAITNDDELARRLRLRLTTEARRGASSLVKEIATNAALALATSRPAFGLTLFPVLRLLEKLQIDPATTYRKTMKKPQTSFMAHGRAHPLQAWLGRSMLAHNEEDLAQRRRNAKLLRAAVSASVQELLLEDHPEHGAYFLMLVSERREEIVRALLRQGVDVGQRVMRYCPPLLGQSDVYPEAERAFRDSIQIPIHSSLSGADIERIAKALEAAVGAAPSVKAQAA